MQRNPAYQPPPPESTFTRSLDTYFRPLQAALSAEEAIAARKEWEPIGATLDSLEVERAAVLASPFLTAEGRAEALRALDNKRIERAAALLPPMARATSKIAEDIATLEGHAIHGLTPLVVNGVTMPRTRRQPGPVTPEELSDAREVRDHIRATYFDPAAPRQSEWRALYRSWVTEGDRRAGWAERDPTDTLVAAADRTWAREWRIHNSEFQPQIVTLTAKLRSYSLLLDSAQRAFGAAPLRTEVAAPSTTHGPHLG